MEFFNIKFVKEVEKHPELYNYTLGEYSRKEFTDKAWNEVAKEVNLSASECKEKWRNLRSTYVKSLKSKPGDSGVTKKKPYYLMDAMQFAKPFVKVISMSTDNIPEIRRSSPIPKVSEMDTPDEETVFSEDMFSEPDVSATSQQQSSTSQPVKRTKPTATPNVTTSTGVTSGSSSPSQRDRVTSSPDLMGTRGLHNLPTRKRKISNYRSQSPTMEFSNIKFVKEVEKYPELYNYTLREYSRKGFTDKVWNKVAKEVNLSAGECKEKWRNLRSTFVKCLKFKPSGGTKKKPYYLMDAMQFAKPFVKLADTSTDNLSEILHPSPTQDASKMNTLEEDIRFSRNIYSEPGVSASGPQQSSSSPLLQRPTPTATPPMSSPGVTSGSSSPSHDDRVTPSPGLMDMGTRGPHNLRKRKILNNQSDTDKVFSEYISAKLAKISNTSKDKREVGIRNFLISLIPDLMQMNDVQLRIYKRKALLLIDEVTETAPEILYHTSRSMAPSYQGTAGFIVNPNQFPQSSYIVPTPTGNNFSLWTDTADHSEHSLSPEKCKKVNQNL